MPGNDIYSNSGRINNSGRMDYGDGFYDDQKESRYLQEPENGSYADNSRPPERKKKKTGLKVLGVIILILGIVLIFLLLFLVVVLSRVHYTTENPDHSIAENAGITLRSDPGVENILIFGEDNHFEGENGRSDSMILLSIDKKHRKLKQTSFMRDMYLEIPGYGYDKLNAAFSYGGAKLATETIEYNFGIRIDNYMIIDFNSFTDIIDSVGGIDLQLTRTEIEYINWQSYKNKQTDKEAELDPDSYSYYEDKDGNNVANVHLIGRQALWYARDRDSAGSDFDRTQRQRIVINTLFEKLKSSGPLKLLSATFAISGYMTTNMNPLTLAGEGFRIIFSLGYQKTEHRVPTSDNYYDDYNDSGSVLVISDTELEKERLYTFIFDE